MTHVDTFGLRLKRTTLSGLWIAAAYWFWIATSELPFGYWFLRIAALFAAAPWMRCLWRFSLRTLLIATTLVAVVLGLIVYVSR